MPDSKFFETDPANAHTHNVEKSLEDRVEDLEKRFDILEKILEAYRV